MDLGTAKQLIDLDMRFYAENAESFSQTRQGAWGGWLQLLELMGDAGIATGEESGEGILCVIDAACGNGRFAWFLEQELSGVRLDYMGIDNCEALLDDFGGEGDRGASGVKLRLEASQSTLRFAPASSESQAASDLRFARGDLLASAFPERGPNPLDGAGPADLVVCFGFFHHVPTQEGRARLLAALVECLQPGGLLAVSFWEPLNSPDIAAAAQTSTADAQAALDLESLDDGDFILGWQGKPGAWRYCHSFCEAEIDDLAAAVTGAAGAEVASGDARVASHPLAGTESTHVRELARYSADGRTGNLNRYLVLQRI